MYKVPDCQTYFFSPRFLELEFLSVCAISRSLPFFNHGQLDHTVCVRKLMKFPKRSTNNSKNNRILSFLGMDHTQRGARAMGRRFCDCLCCK